MLEKNRRRFDDLRRMGKALSNRIAALNPIMEDLAAATCTRCPAPCCLSARIWYDLKDLLVLHLLQQTRPPAQTISKMTDRCRYTGPRGCRLKRADRPWVCTWYLCPTQKDRLRREDAACYDRLRKELEEIGAARKKLMVAFLREDMF